MTGETVRGMHCPLCGHQRRTGAMICHFCHDGPGLFRCAGRNPKGCPGCPCHRSGTREPRDNECRLCFADTGDGEGWAGLCGNCADRAERKETK